MFITGITGPIGAGKTIAMNALRAPGVLTLDCDEIYHELLLQNTAMIEEITADFPDVSENGRINRKKLGELVFGNKSALEDLNKITHKYVMNEINRRLSAHEKQGGTVAIVNAIALIETGFAKCCGSVMCITAPIEMRLARITERDNLTREQAMARIRAQKPDSFYRKNSSVIIENTFENPEDFKNACLRAHKIDLWYCRHTDDMLAELGELIAINSVRSEAKAGAPFGEASREALALGQKLLEKHGLEVDVYKDMVITATLGENPPKLGILTHLDIVEAGEDWDTDPFVLENKDGRLYGRGVTDNKGPAVASMYAVYCVRELFPHLKHAVQLIFGSGEETGFEDIAQYAKDNELPPNVFSPDSEFPVVNIEKGRYLQTFGAKWEKNEASPRILSVQGGRTPNIVPNHATALIKGVEIEKCESYCKEFSKITGVLISTETASDSNAGKVKITAQGKASHASRPHSGNNAQTALVSMLSAMPFAKSKGFEYITALSQLFPHGDCHGKAISLDFEDDISGKTTVNFGVLNMDECKLSAGFDARTAVCADNADIHGTICNLLKSRGFEIYSAEMKKSHHTPEETDFVKSLLKIYEQYSGDEGKCLCMGGLTYVHDIPGGVAFGATRPGCDNNVHGANEYFDVKDLTMCAKVFTQAIIDICGA